MPLNLAKLAAQIRTDALAAARALGAAIDAAGGGSSGASLQRPIAASQAGDPLVGTRTLGRCAEAMTITKIWMTPSDSIVASTNYKGYTLYVYAANGDLVGEAGTITTNTTGNGGTGDQAPFGVYEGTLGAALDVPAGGSVVYEDGEGGSGVNLPDHVLGVDLTPTT